MRTISRCSLTPRIASIQTLYRSIHHTNPMCCQMAWHEFKAPDMNETILYEDGEITVSDERIVTKTGEYSARDVNSVETEATPVFWGIFVLWIPGDHIPSCLWSWSSLPTAGRLRVVHKIHSWFRNGQSPCKWSSARNSHWRYFRENAGSSSGDKSSDDKQAAVKRVTTICFAQPISAA